MCAHITLSLQEVSALMLKILRRRIQEYFRVTLRRRLQNQVIRNMVQVVHVVEFN